MKIIEIAALANGAHRNQSIDSEISLPEGWAVIPEEMEIPETYPFVNLTVENGTVTAMETGVVPEPEPAPKSELEILRETVDLLVLDSLEV